MATEDTSFRWLLWELVGRFWGLGGPEPPKNKSRKESPSFCNGLWGHRSPPDFKIKDSLSILQKH